MEAMRREPQITGMWTDNTEGGVTFEVGTFGRWQNSDGKWRPGKKHPNAILVDWSAAACLAKVDPNQLKREGGYSDAEIETIAGIWDAAVRPSSTSIINLDDDDLKRQIAAHASRDS